MSKQNVIILTPDLLLNIPCDRPVIFLNGPVTNAPDWHSRAIEFFLKANKKIIVVSPSRKIIPLIQVKIQKLDKEYPKFENQFQWEEYYMNKAGRSQKGCMAFWLLGEGEFRPRAGKCNAREMELPERQDPLKVYAHKTQYQLGRWVVKARKANFMVGTDGTYPEIKEVVSDLKIVRPKLVVHKTIGEVCQAALDVVL